MLCASPTRNNIRKRSRHLQPIKLSQPSNLAIQAMTRQPFETALLVTGASGLLGGEVLAQATRQPHPGFLAVWGTWHSQPWALPGSKGYALDVTDRSAVLRLVEQLQPDAIVHTAYLKDGPQAHAVTARGTSHIAEAAAAVGARLVHVSSDVIFDGEHAPYDETAAPAPVHPYGEAKAEAEAEVQRLAPSAAIVRTSLSCDERDRHRSAQGVCTSALSRNRLSTRLRLPGRHSIGRRLRDRRLARRRSQTWRHGHGLHSGCSQTRC